jgi:hypothetical protein
LVQKLIALTSKQKVLNFRKIYTPKFLGCYSALLGCVADPSDPRCCRRRPGAEGAPLPVVVAVSSPWPRLGPLPPPHRHPHHASWFPAPTAPLASLPHPVTAAAQTAQARVRGRRGRGAPPIAAARPLEGRSRIAPSGRMGRAPSGVVAARPPRRPVALPHRLPSPAPPLLLGGRGCCGCEGQPLASRSVFSLPC